MPKLAYSSYSRRFILFLTSCIILIIARGSGASFCGRRGEAVPGKCDLLSVPRGLKLSPDLKLPTLESETSEIFQGLYFSKVDKCSVVGLSEGLLKCRKGPEIDAASVVFRLGFSPLEKFAEYVGTKVNVTLCRSQSCNKGQHHRFTRDLYGFKWTSEYKDATILLKNIQKPTYSYWNSSSILNSVLQEYGIRVSPSTGLLLSIDLLASQKCKSIHVYGLGNGLRRYHHSIKSHGKGREERKSFKLRTQSMKRSHSQDIESNIFERLQNGGYKIYKHDCMAVTSR